MADEIANSTPAATAPTETSQGAVAPVATETVAPVETPAVVEPVPTVTPETPAEKPAEEPAKVDAPAEEVAPETLLAGDKKVEEAAKPEEKPAEEVKPADAAPEEKPAEVELPAFEPFALPENVTVDTEKMGEFTKSLAEFEVTTKVPHEEIQKLGQQMVERHIAEMQRYTDTLTQAWNKQKNDWKEAFLKDPEFTNRSNTVVNAAIDAISVFGGNAEQQKAFRDLMEESGVGNHPAMIRMLSNVMLAKAEPKPLAAPQIASGEKASKISKMYGKKTG